MNFQQNYILVYLSIMCIPVCLLGHYWIDPNGGVPNDAVLVFCDFETLSTCLLPKVSKVA